MLEGKVAVVTGAGGGIGSAIACRLASSGANIVVNDVDEPAAALVAEEVGNLGVEAVTNDGDVSDLAAMEQMVADAMTRWGRVDIMVNNAGITRDALLMRLSEEDWDRVLAINLKGAFLMTQAVVRHMMPHRRGWIVNIASVAGKTGQTDANYVASKAGLIGFTKAVAKDLAPLGIYVNAVAPGPVDGKMAQAMDAERRQRMIDNTPLGRMAKPEEVANVVAFLASPLASFITGATIDVNGGLLMD